MVSRTTFESSVTEIRGKKMSVYAILEVWCDQRSVTKKPDPKSPGKHSGN